MRALYLIPNRASGRCRFQSHRYRFEWFTEGAWIVALHRFIEVSVGIIVALIVVAVWPERSVIPAKNAAV